MVPFNGRFDSHLGMQYWQADMLAMIDEHSSHPSIVQWNLFNEDSENHLFDTGANHTIASSATRSTRRLLPT